MIYQIALCDDEITELEKAEKLLSIYNYPGASLMIRQFQSTDELLSMVREKNYDPDLIIMDICMPKETGETFPMGMEAAKMLRGMGSRAELLFLTRSREYALEAFDVDAAQYLLKPVSKDKLFSMLDRFLKEAGEEQDKYILLRLGGSLKKVALNDIVFCEAQRKSQCIYLEDGTELFQKLTMAKLYELLSSCREFVKVGASYIINLTHIDSLNAQEAQMDNGKKIYLPRGTYSSLREQYFDYYCGLR